MSDEKRSVNLNDDGLNNDWDVCSSGELTGMVSRLDAKQRTVRRNQVFKTVALSTCVFACIVFGLGSFMNGSGNHLGGIACSECRTHLADYQLHLIGESKLEDAEKLASIETHLQGCSFCRDKFNKMYPEQRLGQFNATRPALLFALQPTRNWGSNSIRY